MARQVMEQGREAEDLLKEVVVILVDGAELGGDSRDEEQSEGDEDGLWGCGEGSMRAGGVAATLPEHGIAC